MNIKTQISVTFILFVCFIVAVIVLIFLALLSAPDLIVQLPNGKIRGLNRGHYFSFESIPYAEPLTAANRFEAPKPYSGNWLHIKDATQPPVLCLQWNQFAHKEDLLSGVEDCLTINVYTPSFSGKAYPVLVLIHGGAYAYGGARENGQDFFMENGKVVVVKMNYRLGPLGFLSTADDVISGNFGLKDQLLALEWIKANVAAFNGNPEKITVLGFSSGAASVHFQMMNKNFENIATSAVSMSGTALNYWSIDRTPVESAHVLAKHLNCSIETSSAIKKCLQNKDAKEIVRTVKEFQKNNIGYNPILVFGPVVESKTVSNAFLTDEPEILIKSGKTARVPWLASFVAEDGGYNAAEYMRKDKNGLELIEILNERWNELASKNLYLKNVVKESELEVFTNSVRQKYMRNERFSAKNYFSLQKLHTDITFADATRKSWTLHKKYTHAPVYGYVYDNPAPYGVGNLLSNRTDINFGTVHGDDYCLIFEEFVKKENFSENQKVMSKKFVKMIENFCLTGNLNFGNCKFVENNSTTKGVFALNITKEACNPIMIDSYLENDLAIT